ncbi:MAG: inositol monophosphatase family protein [Alphaproteobacteria bacterium]
MRPALINVIDRAVRKAGRGLVRDFGEVEKLQVSKKGVADFVSTADTKAERILFEELAKARPGFGFLGEEAGTRSAGDGVHRWIVDPLDGTTNFLHGVPHFAISIAVERAGEIVTGAVYDPLSDNLYWAERNGGAWLNDQRLRVSARGDMAAALVATGIPFIGRGDHPRYLATQAAVMAKTAGVRRFGVASLDLAWVAAGRFDGYWEYGLKAWDIAAGLLLVREAGGFASEHDGQGDPLRSGNVVAANDKLHAPLCALLREAWDKAE